MEGRRIADLRSNMLGRRPARQQQQQQHLQQKPGGRHVRWDPGEQYVLLRAGVPWKCARDIDAAYQLGALEETQLYIFQNADKRVVRNPDVPRYEAVHYCADANAYVRAQKCHLQQAYGNADRTDPECMWSTDAATGLPYWVDRHAFCKLKQRQSKSRYERRKKVAL
jgi:hypothetical protein